MFSFGKKRKKSVESLEEASNKLTELEEKIGEITKELKERKKESAIFFQKLGLVRYNPFNGLGGDQSFSLALLDKNDSGCIITSIFTKDNSRIFSKPIIKGRSDYQLSKEEIEAIGQAKQKR